MSRPITIIGGGLCGLGLANGLSGAGVHVRLHEAGRYPRHRVCGEFLAGLSRQTLLDLGIEDCFHDALRHRTTLWFRKGKPVYRFTLPTSALGISRFALDERMADRFVSRGGEILTNSRVAVTAGEGMIAAAGRKARPGGYHGLKVHVRGLTLEADLELHLGRFAYVGLSRVESGRVNVCGLFRSLAKGSFESPIERFFATLSACECHDLRNRLAAARIEEGSFCSVSGLRYGGGASAESARLGDRYKMIPPFTGNGMTMALQSAREALSHILSYARGTLSWEAALPLVNSRLRKRFNRRIAAAGLMHPFLLSPLLQQFLILSIRTRATPVATLYKLTHT